MQISKFVDDLSGDLEPIRELSARLNSTGSEVNNGMVALSHRPNVAPHAYALKLYAPLPLAAVARYLRLHNIALSPHYLPTLGKLNGMDAFRLSLYGVPPSMIASPPLLDRFLAQPLDIARANQFWKVEYVVPDDWFHFGGSSYSCDENIGYFFDPSGAIHAVRKNGEQFRIWTSFRQFLADELHRAEVDYPAFEVLMSEINCDEDKS